MRASVGRLDARFRQDWFLLVCVSLALFVGLITLASADSGGAYIRRQLVYAGLGFALLFFVSGARAKEIERLTPFVFAVGICALLAVQMAGLEINNARRWLSIGPLRAQPSEWMKIACPLMLAWFYARFERVRWFHHFAAGFILAAPFFLVLKQPDLGTAMLIAAAGFAVIFLAGISWQLLIALAAAAAACAPVLWLYVLQPYQKKRVLTLLDPYQDPLGAGYHTIQAEIAVGSGGIWGKGWRAGEQAQLGFLPERHTDFIFAVHAEEFGFVGSAVFLALNLLVVLRAFVIAKNAATPFARLAAGGLGLAYFAAMFVNLGMVSGLLPVVGLPLPLMSYGGTALVTIFIGFGVLTALSRAR
jgi:rod shape determining protein RodA